MYNIVIRFEDGLYAAWHPALDGCIAQGKTMAEAVDALHAFRADYIEHLRAHHLPVPLPEWQASYTGDFPSPRFTVTMEKA